MAWRGMAALAAVATVAAAPAAASDKVQYAPAPTWVLPAALPDIAGLPSDASPLLIIDHQQRMDGGLVWLYFDSATRIATNQMLAQAGTVSLPWAPDQGDLIIHRAEIIRDGQHVDLLDKPDRFTVLRREDALERLSLTGVLTATMAVEGLRIGDVLRVSASVTRRDNALDGGMQTFLPLIPAEARPGYARARLLWPKGQTVQWRSLVEGAKISIAARGGDSELSVPLPLAKAPELPGDAPIRFRPLPIIEATNFADWAAVSRVMAPHYRTDGLIPNGSPLAIEVDAIAKAERDPRRRAAAALQLVQDKVRYLFEGMDGGNYRPQTPVRTWTVRYGDCKAKTLLLLAMLHRLGIEAEPVLANTELGDYVPKRLPSPGAFNHVIVRATIDSRNYWLDGTTLGTRLADLGDVPAFRHVLPVRADGAQLMALDSRPDSRPTLATSIDIDSSAGIDVPMLYTVTMTARGQLAEMLDNARSQANKDQQEELARGMISEVIDPGAIVTHNLKRDAAAGTSVLTVKGISGTPWRRENRRYTLTGNGAIAKVEFTPDRARAAWRDIPVARGGSGGMTTALRVRLPDGGQGYVIDGNQPLPAQLAGIAVTRQATLAGGVFEVKESAFSDAAEVAPAAIAAERAAVTRVRDRPLRLLAPPDVATRAAVARGRADPRYKSLLDSYAELIAADPKEANSYSNRAGFLAGIFDFRGALPDYDRAIAIEPSAQLHLQRGQVLRALGEDAKALADYVRAAELEPDNRAALVGVTQLTALGGDHAKATALLEERGAGFDPAMLEGIRSDLLALAGRKDEAAAAMERAMAGKPVDAGLLNERCWLRGTQNIELAGALRDCTRSIELAEGAAAPLDSRALVYFRMDRMAEALDDLRAALEIAPGQAASLYLRGVIRKRQGDAGAAADLAAARRISPRIDEEYRRYGIVP